MTPDEKKAYVGWFTQNARLLRWAARQCDTNMIDELASQAATKIFELWSRPEIREKIIESPGYVVKIVRNLHLDHLKSRGMRGKRLEVSLSLMEQAEPVLVLDREVDEIVELRAAIMKLDDVERTFIYHRYYEGHTITESAAMVGVKNGSDFNKKILRQLEQLLTPLEEGS